jgi:hypothetical protein
MARGLAQPDRGMTTQMFIAKLTTAHNTFWLSGKGHWLTDESRAWHFSTRQSAYRYAAKTRCVSRKWGDKVTALKVEGAS